MDRNLVLQALLIMGILGLAIAGYQTYEHHVLGYSGCNFSDVFSCEIVTSSAYGEFPPNSGIATAAWGIPWWLAFILLTATLLAGNLLFAEQEAALFFLTLSGLGMVIYLLTVELYLLPQETGQLAICPFCTVQHILIVGSVLMTYRLLDRPVRSYLPSR